jgi:hypothetical protein
MRIKHAILAGSMAALVSLTAPALARTSDTKTTSEQPASSSLQRPAADGGWNMGAASASGSGFPQTSPAPIRGARHGPANTLSRILLSCPAIAYLLLRRLRKLVCAAGHPRPSCTCAGKERGWPGHLARRRASRFCPVMTNLAGRARLEGNAASTPSAAMRSLYDLHGAFDMAPLLGFFGLALALASQGIFGRLGDRLKAVLVDHLPRDRVNLRLGHHVALPCVPPRPEPQRLIPQGMPRPLPNAVQYLAAPPIQKGKSAAGIFLPCYRRQPAREAREIRPSVSPLRESIRIFRLPSRCYP